MCQYKIEEISADDRHLIEQAREATNLSYSPYSRFAVGAAVLLSNGQIVKGANQENASYPVGICAARSALYTAQNLFPGISVEAIALAARNDKGRVVMYADNMTQSMQRAYDETMRRRKIQDEYNKAHGIVPKTVVSAIKNSLEITKKAVHNEKLSVKDMIKEVERLKGLMQTAAAQLDFEKAILIRDELNDLKKQIKKLS